MAVFYRLTKSNMKGKSAGRYYAKAVTMGELHTNDLAAMVSESNSVTESDVHGVLIALIQQMKQGMKDGKTVVLDGLGRFKLTLETESVADPSEFSAAKHIHGVHCSFIEEGRKPQGNHRQTKIFSTGVEIKAAPVNDVEK
jgi:predicted histone-like DNA-binding protein